jgi:hypothetical protein
MNASLKEGRPASPSDDQPRIRQLCLDDLPVLSSDHLATMNTSSTYLTIYGVPIPQSPQLGLVVLQGNQTTANLAINERIFLGVSSSSPAGSEGTNDEQSELENIFNGLAKQWRQATGGYSLTMRRYAHASYQSILALAPKRAVASLILRELEQRPDRWFEALKALTNANPAQNAKTFDETVQRWIEWGKAEKYIT